MKNEKKSLKIDFDKLIEASDDLKKYEGFLPLLIRAIIMRQHSKTLKKAGIYEKVINKEIRTKPKTYDGAVKELEKWCNENKEYKKVIK